MPTSPEPECKRASSGDQPPHDMIAVTVNGKGFEKSIPVILCRHCDGPAYERATDARQ